MSLTQAVDLRSWQAFHSKGSCNLEAVRGSLAETQKPAIWRVWREKTVSL
jgi:hypothetical protein